MPSQQAAWQPAGKDTAEAIAENLHLTHKSEAERTRLNQGVFLKPQSPLTHLPQRGHSS